MKPTIFVVDDEPLITELISQILQRTLGAVVQVASTNEAAFKLLEKNAKPDLIISDYNRPGSGNGLEFLVAIKGSSETERIPTAIVSGKISIRQELALYRAGAAFILRKPFTIPQLTQQIRRLLKLPDDHLRDLIRMGKESRDLDYKAGFDITNKKARAGIAKDVIAMANSGGGYIVIGIAEDDDGFRPTGIPDHEFLALETTKINDALQTYTGPIAVSLSKLKYNGKNFAVISIPSAITLIFPRKEHPDAQLFLGRIYHRTNAARSEELRDASEAAQLIEALAARRSRSESSAEDVRY